MKHCFSPPAGSSGIHVLLGEIGKPYDLAAQFAGMKARPAVQKTLAQEGFA